MKFVIIGFVSIVLIMSGIAFVVTNLSVLPTRQSQTTAPTLSVPPPETLPVPPPETLPVNPTITPDTPVTPIPTRPAPTPDCEAAKLLFAGSLGQARWDLKNRPTLDAILTARRLVETGQWVLDGC